MSACSCPDLAKAAASWRAVWKHTAIGIAAAIGIDGAHDGRSKFRVNVLQGLLVGGEQTLEVHFIGQICSRMRHAGKDTEKKTKKII